MGTKIFWTGIVTIPFAIVQAIFCVLCKTVLIYVGNIVACLILLLVLIIAIGVGSYISNISCEIDEATLRSVTGINIGSWMNSYFAGIVTIIVLIAVALVALSVLLCVGICQNKPGNIMVYVSCGGIVAIGRMTMLTRDNFRCFPDDKTVLYLGLYTLYLILLVVHVVNIKRARDQGAILAVPMAYPKAASAPNWSPAAPPPYKDATEYQPLV